MLISAVSVNLLHIRIFKIEYKKKFLAILFELIGIVSDLICLFVGHRGLKLQNKIDF